MSESKHQASGSFDAAAVASGAGSARAAPQSQGTAGGPGAVGAASHAEPAGDAAAAAPKAPGSSPHYPNHHAGAKPHGKQYRPNHANGAVPHNGSNPGSNVGSPSAASPRLHGGRKGAGAYNGQKMAAAQQYNSYNQYAQGMYPYQYYGNPYAFNPQMVPGMPGVQAYTQAQVQLQSPQPGLPQLPQPHGQVPIQSPPIFSPPAAPKVKITDREGKQIDLEGKKKQSQSTTPVSSPSSGVAVPSAGRHGDLSAAQPTSAPTTVTSSPASNAVPAAAKLSIAEEFKRKILEKAAKAAQAKQPAEKKAPEPKATQPEAPEAKMPETKVREPEVVESKVPETKTPETTASETKAVTPEVAQVEPAKPQPTDSAKEEPVQAEPIKEELKEERKEQPTEELKQESSEEPKQDPKEEPKQELEEEPKQEPKEKPKGEPLIAAPTEEPSVSAQNTEETQTESDEPQAEAEPSEEPQPIETVSGTTADSTVDAEDVSKDASAESDIAEESGQGDDDAEGSADEGFTLSDLIAKVGEATAIEDPFSHKYPEGLQAPDPRWKMEEIKFRYDPVFLMQFQDVTAVALDSEWKNKLDGLGITGNKARGGSNQSRGSAGKFGNNSMGGANSMMGMNRLNNGPLSRGGQFSEGRQNSRTGSKRKGGSSGGGVGGGLRDRSARKGQSGRGARNFRDELLPPSKPLEEVKPLVKSENRWVPKSRAKKTEVKLAPDGTELLEPEEVERKINSLLNKLTLEMFEQITDEMMKIANQSKWEEDAKTVRQVISLTFAKACDEPYWSLVYAQFCAKMCKEMSDEIKDVNIVKNGEVVSGGDLARRILLATCQVEYEKGWTDKLPTNEDGTPLEPEMMSDEYYIMAAAKRRGLGLVKFIGHLYILNMLNDQVILLCLRDQSSNTEDPSEDRLENLAQLINTVGARLETKEKTKAALNFVFDNVQTILDNCKISSRIKFMLMDLIDLRKNHWVLAKKESGPKTIQEIHDDAELKRYADEKAKAESRRKGKMGGDSRSNSSRGGSTWGSLNKKDMRAPMAQPQKDSRGFTSVSRAQSSRQNLASESSSAAASPRDNSKRADSIQSAANIFAALGDEGDHDDDEADDKKDETDK